MTEESLGSVEVKRGQIMWTRETRESLEVSGGQVILTYKWLEVRSNYVRTLSRHVAACHAKATKMCTTPHTHAKTPQIRPIPARARQKTCTAHVHARSARNATARALLRAGFPHKARELCNFSLSAVPLSENQRERCFSASCIMIFLSHAPWSAYRCRSRVRRDERLKEEVEDAVQQIKAR